MHFKRITKISICNIRKSSRNSHENNMSFLDPGSRYLPGTKAAAEFVWFLLAIGEGVVFEYILPWEKNRELDQSLDFHLAFHKHPPEMLLWQLPESSAKMGR